LRAQAGLLPPVVDAASSYRFDVRPRWPLAELAALSTVGA